MEIIFIYNKTNNQNKKVKDKIVNYVNQSYNVFRLLFILEFIFLCNYAIFLKFFKSKINS